jgi:hypothetical protein
MFFHHLVHLLKGHLLPLPLFSSPMSRRFFYWLMRVRHGSAGNWEGYELDRNWISVFHAEIAPLSGFKRLSTIFRVGMTR